MVPILVDSTADDDSRRRALYDGALLFFTARDSVRALCDHAWQMITEAFDPLDPMEAQSKLPVEEYVGIIGPLKTRFTNEDSSKERLHDLLDDFGCDVSQTYFDVPKLRIVTHSNYLTAGVGYAYKPHRDIWYSAPPCQLNWWLPISEISTESALAFHPHWWNEAAPNTSGNFDPYEWNRVGRAEAAKHITSDPRNHPAPSEPIELEPELRIVGGPASTLIFSAAHLHSTVPNTSRATRFSIDFRTVNQHDLVERVGAPNPDSASTGTTARDFLRATDYERLPEDVVALYDIGSKHEGPLVFDPTTVGG
jgi:hypothetical protein